MRNLEEVKKQINDLKIQLNLLTETNNELFGENILQTSEALDELINLYNKMISEPESRD